MKSKTVDAKFTINGTTTDDQTLIDNSFCQHFVDSTIRIHNSIPPSTSDFTNLVAYNRNSLKLRSNTSSELRKHIAGLRKEGQI